MSGYKLSDVGPIPSNWAVRKVSELIEDRAILSHLDGNHGALYPRNSDFRQYGVPYIGANDFDSGFVTFQRCKFLGEEKAAEFKKGIAKDGDVLFAHNATVGPVALLVTSEPFVILSTTATYFRCDDQKLNNNYLKFALQSPYFVRQYQAVMSQSTRFQVPITAQRKFSLGIPPVPEQRAIATALSDVDALLTKLDQIITKKRDLKQAALQQLLIGQTRLPGFSGEWEVKRLGDIFSISAGKSKSAFIFSGGQYWIVDMGSVSIDGRLIVSKPTNYFGDFLRIGDLVMPKDDIGGGGIIGKVGYINADETYVLGDHIYRLTANIGNSLFLFYVVNSYRTNTELRKKVIGSAQLGLGRKSVNEQLVQFPPLDEQTAIATILSDMDAELVVLEARREKTKAIKQGMMQELLTGRIRLV